MNHEETARVCHAIAVSCPAQRFDPETPAMWQPALRDVRLVDAVEAVGRLVARQPFISPADLIAEVRQIRYERLEEVGFMAIVPNVDPTDAVGYRDELAAIRAAAGDGTFDPARYAAGGYTLTGRPPLRALGQDLEGTLPSLEGVFREP